MLLLPNGENPREPERGNNLKSPRNYPPETAPEMAISIPGPNRTTQIAPETNPEEGLTDQTARIRAIKQPPRAAAAPTGEKGSPLALLEDVLRSAVAAANANRSRPVGWELRETCGGSSGCGCGAGTTGDLPRRWDRAQRRPGAGRPHACARVDAAHGANTAAASLSAPVPISSFPSIPLLPSRSYLSPNSSPPFLAGKTLAGVRRGAAELVHVHSPLHCSPGQTKALSSFPILHCHSPTLSRPLSATAATGVARRSSQGFRRRAAHAHSSLRSTSGRTEGTISFLVPRWCSPTASPSLSDPDVAAATAVVDLVPGHPRPRDLAQTNHGEPLSISPHFPGPVSPPFGRRHGCVFNLFPGGCAKNVGTFYDLVPAAEEIAQESEVNVVHVDPSPEQEYRFEPEGKPRSIT
nr:unnamed protein product [Digitaria exilis]